MNEVELILTTVNSKVEGLQNTMDAELKNINSKLDQFIEAQQVHNKWVTDWVIENNSKLSRIDGIQSNCTINVISKKLDEIDDRTKIISNLNKNKGKILGIGIGIFIIFVTGIVFLIEKIGARNVMNEAYKIISK